MMKWDKDVVVEEILKRKSQGLGLRKKDVNTDRVYFAARRIYGTWEAALEASGLNPKDYKGQKARVYWTKEKVIKELQTRHEQGLPVHGGEVTRTSLHRGGRRLFGSWLKALEASGVDVEIEKGYLR